MLIGSGGYPALTMRAVARASGLKLGALQYHYRTREDLLRAVAAYISSTYRVSFQAFQARIKEEVPDLRSVVRFLVEDSAGDPLQADRLFPQLWAMALVEPIMKEELGNIYNEYLLILDDSLRALGVDEPRADSLLIMAMIEGLTILTGDGARWDVSHTDVLEGLFALLDARYVLSAPSLSSS